VIRAARFLEINNVTDTQNNRLSHRACDPRTGVYLPRRAYCATVIGLIGLVGCTSTGNFLQGDKVDYKSAAVKTPTLEVPPDLTQLSRDSRFAAQDSNGTFSAATYQSGGVPTTSPPTIAPGGDAGLRIERSGNDRWLVTTMSPEQLWPLLKTFWQERGFTLSVDQSDVGVMETEWAENRAKLPQDFIRSTIGSVLDSVYSTGERDKFRTRLERTTTGSEIYMSHRGMIEVATGAQKDSTMWQPRPADPELEVEMLRRLLLKLGAKEEQAKAMVASGTAMSARARMVPGSAAALEVDEGFERAWRRVGVALDRSGFTVEDRDRMKGTYFVRYSDGSAAPVNKEEPGFLKRWFGFGKDANDAKAVARYRVQVKSAGDRTTVSVLSSEGVPENGTVGTRIAALLVEDLK
jgi:outer membrane protein assembly factor BamC